MTRTPLFTALATTALLLSAPITTAIATEDRVGLRGYNLQNAADLDRLHRKIVQTAERVCKKEYKNWDYSATTRPMKKCVREAVDQTIAATGHVALERTHQSIRVSDRYDPNRKALNTVTIAGQ